MVSVSTQGYDSLHEFAVTIDTQGRLTNVKKEKHIRLETR